MVSRRDAIISISLDDRKVMDMLTGYQRTIPEALDLGTKNLAGIYARHYLEQMPKAKSTNPNNPRGIQPWTGRSFAILRKQIIHPEKLGKNSYGVLVPSNLVALDQMMPHKVALKRGRSITRWANRKLGYHGRSITVYPHPWINQANRKARRFIKKHPRKELNQAIRRKGK